jgi:hypothetical protein
MSNPKPLLTDVKTLHQQARTHLEAGAVAGLCREPTAAPRAVERCPIDGNCLRAAVSTPSLHGARDPCQEYGG